MHHFITKVAMSDQTQETLREAGVVCFILDVIETRKDHPEIIKKAMIAICALAKKPATLNELIQVGTCEMIIDVCRSFKKKPKFSKKIKSLIKRNKTSL